VAYTTHTIKGDYMSFVMEKLEDLVCDNCIYAEAEENDCFISCHLVPPDPDTDGLIFPKDTFCGQGRWMVNLDDDGKNAPYALTYSEALETMLQRGGCCGNCSCKEVREE
jgi:hypothetical protein